MKTLGQKQRGRTESQQEDFFPGGSSEIKFLNKLASWEEPSYFVNNCSNTLHQAVVKFYSELFFSQNYLRFVNSIVNNNKKGKFCWNKSVESLTWDEHR